ncbi:unnamed protein product, partial [Symbiodinium pilosum]
CRASYRQPMRCSFQSSHPASMARLGGLKCTRHAWRTSVAKLWQPLWHCCDSSLSASTRRAGLKRQRAREPRCQRSPPSGDAV